MPGKTTEVFVTKPKFIPHLDGIGPAFRQVAEKRVEIGDEIAPMLVITRPETRELEHQHSDFLPNVFAWFEKRRREQISVQEIGIPLTGLCAEAVEIRKMFYGESISHLEAESKIIGHLVCQTLEIFPTREIVICRVHANRFENFRVF